MGYSDLGLTFSPTATTDPTKAQRDPNAPVQEAIRTLSLRIPKVLGARGMAPAPLLNGPGAAGVMNPQGMDLERLLRMLFGQMTGQTPAQSAPGTAPLSPSSASFGAPQTTNYGGGYTAPTSTPSAPSSPYGGARVTPGLEAPAGEGLNDAPLEPYATNTLGSNLTKNYESDYTSGSDRYSY